MWERKLGSLATHVKSALQASWHCLSCTTVTWCSTQVDDTHFMLTSSIRIMCIVDLEIWNNAANFLVERWQSSSITMLIVLILASVVTLFLSSNVAPLPPFYDFRCTFYATLLQLLSLDLQYRMPVALIRMFQAVSSLNLCKTKSPHAVPSSNLCFR